MAENDKLNNDDSTFKETKENKSSKKIEGYDDYYKSLTSGSDEHDNDIDYHEDSHVNTRTTTSSKKFNPIAFLFLALIGLIFAVVGVFLLVDNKNKSDYKQTQAVISDIQSYYDDGKTHYTTYVDYEVNGVKYSKVKLDVYSSIYYVGKTITIDYNPSNPNQITILSTSNIFSYASISIGAVCAAAGIWLFIKYRKTKNDNNDSTFDSQSTPTNLNSNDETSTLENNNYENSSSENISAENSTTSFESEISNSHNSLIEKRKNLRKIIRFVPIIFVGLAMTIMFSYAYNTNTNIKNKCETVEAVVVSVKDYKEDKYTVFVNFEYKGESYNNAHFTTKNSYTPGDIITIYCNTENPTYVYDDFEDNILFKILSGVGSGILVLGVVLVVVQIIKNRSKNNNN